MSCIALLRFAEPHEVHPLSLAHACRWHNHLNPNIKRGQWTRQEDEIIVRFHRCYGNQVGAGPGAGEGRGGCEAGRWGRECGRAGQASVIWMARGPAVQLATPCWLTIGACHMPSALHP